jgi:hypothetical protein
MFNVLKPSRSTAIADFWDRNPFYNLDVPFFNVGMRLVGGLRFWRVGRFGGSFYLKAPNRAWRKAWGLRP